MKFPTLIVDDEGILREMIIDILSHDFNVNEFDIVETDNGEEALKWIKEKKFELLITDLSMPKMNGVALVNSITKLDEDRIPHNILILSGYHEENATEKQAKNSQISYMDKPLRREVFSDYIKKIKV